MKCYKCKTKQSGMSCVAVNNHFLILDFYIANKFSSKYFFIFIYYGLYDKRLCHDFCRNEYRLHSDSIEQDILSFGM